MHLSLLLQKPCDDNHLCYPFTSVTDSTDIEVFFKALSVPKNECIIQNEQCIGVLITSLSYTKKRTQVCIWQWTEAVFALDNVFWNVLYFQGHMYSSWYV